MKNSSVLLISLVMFFFSCSKKSSPTEPDSEGLEGTKKWKFKTEDHIKSSPAIGSDGTIYIGSEDYNLYAINPDGIKKWEFLTENEIWSSPVIGSDGTIYIGSHDNHLYAVYDSSHSANAIWTMFQHDPQHTGCISYEPPKQALIVLRSEPDPIPYTHDDNGYHYWDFDYYVKETAGVGATLVEWKYSRYKNNNELINSGTYNIQDFIDWFTECNQTNGYINPNGTICCKPFWYGSPDKDGFYSIESMKFIDDNHNECWATVRFNFLAVP